MRKNTLILKISLFLIIVGLCAGLCAEILQNYKGTLTPPSDEEWQQMLNERQTRHACMHKHEKAQDAIKYNTMAINSEPTASQYRVDILYYKLILELDLSSETIDGYLETQVKSLYDGLDQLDFNLTTSYGAMYVSDVYLNGSPASSFTHSNDLLTVYFGQDFDNGDEFTLKIEYNGIPGFDGDDGMYFYTYGSTDVCYTNCEPWGARLWWPCKDHPYDKPDSMDLIITHPSTTKLVSNGVMRSSVNNGDGTKTTSWHENHPIATYLVQLGCANYTLYSDSWQYESGQYMPIENYSYPGIPSYSHSYSLYYMINYIKPSLEALSYYFSLYPFVDEKYGHNHYGWNGAMEHQTITSISPSFNTEYVIAHELGHQWAGDMVTCYTFHHMWLNEGFASYSEPLYFRYHYGESYYKDWLQSQKHLDAGTPYVEDIINDNMFDNTTVYDKGSWLVYMLHMILGEEGFIEMTDSYFNNPGLAFGAATTSDLEVVCEQVYGADLSWFFNEWVYLPGNPNYVYSYMYETDNVNGGYDMYIMLRQVQSWSTFKMPVDMHVFAGGWDSAFTVFNSQRGQVWELDVPNPPDSVWVDRDEKILRTVEYSPDFSLCILAAKEVDTAYIGQPYYAEFSAVGGIPDYHWTRISGQYPYGLTFHDSNTAYLDGTPTWSSDFLFTLEVTDSDTPASADTISLKIVVVEGDIPDVPEQISPSNGITTGDNQPEFVWSSTAGTGGSYTIQTATNISFTLNLSTVNNISDTVYTPSFTMTDGLWYWRVKAVSEEGQSSAYQSTPFQFTIDSSQPTMSGDCNDDGIVNVSDAVYIINYVFIAGPAPDPLETGDTNCDSVVNVSDAVRVINYVFIGGTPPCDL